MSDVVVMVGTMKGAFLLKAGRERKGWKVEGPLFPGHAVYSMAFDGRAGRKRLWAASASMHWGAVLRSSDDLGKSWTNPEVPTLKFPEEAGVSLKQIWQIVPGRAEEPETMYCGVEPAALFESRDAGASWSLVKGLFDHPHRPKWEPGGGGLCMHTVLPNPRDPKQIHVAISTAGVYRTDDGGATWRTAHSGVRAQFLPNQHPEFGQCVHKVARDATRPERLFLQNHWGLYRSDDGGDSWQDIANGVPSDFGFPVVTHPRDPETAYILPLTSDEFRCVPEGKLRVYRTRDGGGSWQPLTKGLPQKGAFETVLRDGMAADGLDPAGIYFGTRSGKVYGSSDGGNSWGLIVDGLPAIVCVKTALPNGVGSGKKTAAKGKRKVAAKGKKSVAKGKKKVAAKGKKKGRRV